VLLPKMMRLEWELYGVTSVIPHFVNILAWLGPRAWLLTTHDRLFFYPSRDASGYLMVFSELAD
jgi:hypothetical protein